MVVKESPVSGGPPTTESSGMMSYMNGFWYDVFIALSTLGRERWFREEILQLVHLHPGMQVLDVACGTGSMALIASDLVTVPVANPNSPRSSTSGRVVGIDASAKFIERAISKAKGKDPKTISFQQGLAENLPFPDGTFDVAMMTISLHHFPTEELQKAVIVEMKRVLKPGGTMLLVDFPHGWFPTNGVTKASKYRNNSDSAGNGKIDSTVTKSNGEHPYDDDNQHRNSHNHEHGHSHHHNHCHCHGLTNLPCFSACSGLSKDVDNDDDDDGGIVENDPLYKKTEEAGFFFVEGSKVRFLNTIAVTGRK